MQAKKRLMDGKTPVLFISQYGEKYWAKTLKELKSKVGPGAIHKIYRDSEKGVMHVGYSIGPLWFSAYVHHEVLA